MKLRMNVRVAIPLLIQEGWLRHQEKDAKPPQRRRRGGRDCRSVSECVSSRGFRVPTTRPLRQRRLRDFFLMSRALLLSQEGIGAPNSFML
jgi:hypothetical protein